MDLNYLFEMTEEHNLCLAHSPVLVYGSYQKACVTTTLWTEVGPTLISI